jgi:hypothetical protein
LIKYSDEYFFVYEWIYFMLEKLLWGCKIVVCANPPISIYPPKLPFTTIVLGILVLLMHWVRPNLLIIGLIHFPSICTIDMSGETSHEMKQTSCRLLISYTTFQFPF